MRGVDDVVEAHGYGAGNHQRHDCKVKKIDALGKRKNHCIPIRENTCDRESKLTEEELGAELVHQEGQDDGSGYAGHPDVDCVQVDRCRDLALAAVRVEVGRVLGDGGDNAH